MRSERWREAFACLRAKCRWGEDRRECQSHHRPGSFQSPPMSVQKDRPRDRSKPMDLGLKGRVAIVVAASKGLGRAVAAELGREGAQVAICARNAADLERAASSIREATGNAIFWQALDVTDAARVQQFVDAVEKRFGRVDICVTNAGGSPAETFLAISLEERRVAVEMTLLSAGYFAREILPRIRKNKWGRLVTITSMAGKRPIDRVLRSNLNPSAGTGPARTLAEQFGKDGITVNNVCPGYTLTERLDELAEKQARDAGVPREKIFERWTSRSEERRCRERV